MRKRAEEGIGVGREIYSSGVGFEIQDGANERWILMRETIMFLARPRRGLDIIDAGDVFAPLGFSSLCGHQQMYQITV